MKIKKGTQLSKDLDKLKKCLRILPTKSIIIAIAVICFGLGGLALVIYNIKNDEKDGDPDDSSKEEH